MQYRYPSQSFIFEIPPFFFLFLSVLQQYSMLIRDKSKSKLSHSSSKSKIKETIRIALGKSNPTPDARPFQNKVLRSESAKSLKSYQKSSVQASSVGVSQKISRSNSQRCLDNKKGLGSQSILGDDWKKNESSVKKEQKIIDFSWWHHRNFRIESQNKTIDKNGSHIFLQYFAYTQNNRKNVVAAIENNLVHIGVTSVKVFSTGEQGKISLIEEQQGIDLGRVKNVIIVKQMDRDQQQYIQGMNKLMHQVEDKAFLKSFIKSPIEYYIILIGKRQQVKSKAEEIMKKIVKNQNSDNSNKRIGDHRDWKSKMGSKIKISQQALLRYKR